MYAIQTDENGHVIAYDKEHPVVFDPDRDFLFAELPDGITEENIFDYAYQNGEWILDPPEPVEPEESIDSLKEKIMELQEQNDMLTECIMEMSEIIYG